MLFRSVMADRGVKTRVLSPSLIAAIEGAVEEVLVEAAARDDTFARVLAHQRAFHAEYARWQRLAYPARDDGPVRDSEPGRGDADGG